MTLVTGASSGIGRQTAIRLSATRCLLLAGRNTAELDRARQQCANPDAHRLWAIDLARPADIAASLRAVTEQTGTAAPTPIDGFVHCAGVLTVRPLRLTTLDETTVVMNVNFVSAVEITRHLVSQRLNGQSLRSIVFVSSIASQFGAKGHAVYSASKGALDALMRSLAVELAPRVRVNSVLPGAVPTPMTTAVMQDPGLVERLQAQYPLGLGSPDDVAAAIEFLMSDSARWITGQQLKVDGGRTTDITA